MPDDRAEHERLKAVAHAMHEDGASYDQISAATGFGKGTLAYWFNRPSARPHERDRESVPTDLARSASAPSTSSRRSTEDS